MSKEGNMEELQRWKRDYRGDWYRHPEGEYVRFSDVAEREARLKARIKQTSEANEWLTDRLNDTRDYWRGQVEPEVDARWRERIEAKARDHDKWAAIDEKESRTSEDDHFRSETYSMRAARHRVRAETLRSLLDSGEEQKASEPAIYEGYGRKWERVKGTSALREVGDTGPDWDQCVYHMIGGRVQRFLMAEREARPSPSPALEGREDECSGLCADTGDCSLECGSAEGGFASGVTTNSEPSPGGETDEYAARARGRAESGQSPVRDGEVTVARADLQVALDWRSDDPEDNYPDVNEAFNRLRSVLAREGGDGE